jgi:hypothetical protein
MLTIEQLIECGVSPTVAKRTAQVMEFYPGVEWEFWDQTYLVELLTEHDLDPCALSDEELDFFVNHARQVVEPYAGRA